MSTKSGKVAASDRSMATDTSDRSKVFFFPKRNPPVSIRAESREEAERQLQETNPPTT